MEQPKHRKWIHLILVGIILAVFAAIALKIVTALIPVVYLAVKSKRKRE